MGTIKAIIGILVIVGGVYCVFQIAPPEMANYSFEDDLKSIAMTAGANPKTTDDDLVASVIKKAKEHDIDLAPEAVTVKRVGSVGAPAVYLATDYSVPVSLPGYSFTLHFTPSSGNNTN
jgi:hypothetical protein